MRTYFFGLATIILLYISNVAGIYFGLYTSAGLYDIPMHILGGLGIGLSAVAAIKLHGSDIYNKRQMVLLVVILAGLAWELFEAYYNITGSPVGTKAYILDTIKDFVDDVFGGIIAISLEFKGGVLRADR